MKEKVSPNRKTGSLIVKNLIVLLAVVAAAFSGMYSWFYVSKPVANGIDVVCSKPDGISLAVVPHGAEPPKDSDYTVDASNTVELSNFEFIKNLSLTDVTSDGTEGSFYKQPATVQGVNHWTKADMNSDYISFDLYFRSRAQGNIYIRENSVVIPDSAPTKDSITDANLQEFKDCIVGATRVSILDETSSQQKLLWVTAPNIWYDQKNKSVYKNINSSTVKTGLSAGDTFKHTYCDGKNDDTTVKSINSGNFFVASSLDSDSNYVLGQKKLVSVLRDYKQTFNTESYYVNHVTVNIWIEGTDAEAHKAFVGGKFKAVLNFSVG
jgi:hypothetical protein